MFRRKFLIAALLAATTLLVAPATSEATFQFKLKLETEQAGGSAEFDLLAGSALVLGGTGGAGNGAYSFGIFSRTVTGIETDANFANLQFGGYTISVNFNNTNSPGDPNGGWLTITGLNITRAPSGPSADTLKISLTATDYDLPDPQKVMRTGFTLQAPNASAGSISLTSYYDSTNSLYGTGASNNMTASLPSNVGSTEKFATLGSSTGTYSLTNVIDLSNLNKGGSINQGTITTTVIAPAPPGLVMLVGALPFFGLLRRRLRKNEAATVA